MRLSASEVTTLWRYTNLFIIIIKRAHLKVHLLGSYEYDNFLRKFNKLHASGRFFVKLRRLTVIICSTIYRGTSRPRRYWYRHVGIDR